MRKRYIFLAIMFLAILILLPFLVEWAYKLGETHPIILTRYAASDVLAYIATVIGLTVSIIALLISLNGNQAHIRIDHAITVNDKNETCIHFTVVNGSAFDCEIYNVSLLNKRNKRRVRIISSPPFMVKARLSEEFSVPIQRVRYAINHILDKQNPRLIYEIRLNTNEIVYTETGALLPYLTSCEEQEKKLETAINYPLIKAAREGKQRVKPRKKHHEK